MNFAGMELKDFGEGTTPLECILLAKTLDADGDIVWVARTSDGLNLMERTGMIEAERQHLLSVLRNGRLDDH